MPETDLSDRIRQYEAMRRELEMSDDTCFIDLQQGCHAGSADHDHNCACLACIQSGAAFTEEG